MIKFFRRIRQKSLTENKFSKYLLYAIGEILLVVIGILIALQLNNLNDSSKDKQLESKYLMGILENIDEDISELNDLFEMDTTRLNNYTLLHKAFADENIRSDRTLLKSAILGAWGIYSFDGNRVIFDDMKFSGKINLIQSDSLRKSIMTYYNYSDDVLEAADKNFNGFHELQEKVINARVGITSLAESLLEEEWSSMFYDFDNSFFNKDINDDEVKEFTYHLTIMKLYIKRSAQRRKILLQQAKQLKKQIYEYLGVEIASTRESTFVAKKDSLVSSSLENVIPISHEELKAFAGDYQLVKTDNKDRFKSHEFIKIYPEHNHLLVYTVMINSYGSFYTTAKDEFAYAYSFLFDDEESKWSILFGRDSNNEVIELIAKGWHGIYEYKKIN